MNIEDYDSLRKSDEDKNLAIDFDGVIHKNSKGFHDGTIYDEPIEGSLEALKQLSKEYKIIIFSCKCKPDRPLVNGKTGSELLFDWLTKHNVMQYVSEITSEKPRAVAYIDDKGIKFNNWETTLKEIDEIE